MTIGRAAPAADELVPLPPEDFVALAAAVDALCSSEEATDEAEATTDEADDLAEPTAPDADEDAPDAADEADALTPEPLAPPAPVMDV